MYRPSRTKGFLGDKVLFMRNSAGKGIFMINIPEVKIGLVAVSRDCFPASLAVNRRKALVEA